MSKTSETVWAFVVLGLVWLGFTLGGVIGFLIFALTALTVIGLLSYGGAKHRAEVSASFQDVVKALRNGEDNRPA